MGDDERGNFPSASGLHRLAVCRSSWRHERGRPESSHGQDWREEGTLLHDCAEKEITPDSLTEDERWAVRSALYHKNAFYEQFNIVGSRFKEQRLWAHKPDLTPLFSGKFDEAIVGEDICSIVDYKFGRKEVPEAIINSQMHAYAVLCWLRWPGRKLYATCIVQPRIERKVSWAAFTPQQCQEFYEFFLSIIEEAETSQEFGPDDHACEYCRALPVCRAAWNHYTNTHDESHRN